MRARRTRPLGRDQSVTASYVGSAGRRLLTNLELNDAPPGQAPPNPNFSRMRLITNDGSSDYHALQVQVQRRMARGLQALVNYTWSHAIDLVSIDVQGSASELARGNASFDVRHNVSAALTAHLPGLRSEAWWAGITRGWTIDAIVHAQSGFPVDIVGQEVVLDVPLYIEDPGVPGGRRFNAAAVKRVPPEERRRGTLGRNVFRGLPLQQVDLALERRFRLAGRLTARLRAEAFNLFNHPNFTGFGAYAGGDPGTFGVPTSMMNNGFNGGLSSLYQIGGPRSMQLSLRLAF